MYQLKLTNLVWLLEMWIVLSLISSNRSLQQLQRINNLHLRAFITSSHSKTWPLKTNPLKMFSETAVDMLQTGFQDPLTKCVNNTFLAMIPMYPALLARTCSLNPLQSAPKQPLVAECQEVTTLCLKCVSCQPNVPSSPRKITEESVSFLIWWWKSSKSLDILVENIEMRPMQDYNDYTKYVNNQNSK